jgi:tetratricopeptide (TPR) repeat protein
VPPPPSEKSVLTAWQRPLVRLLVFGAVVVAGSGLYLLWTPGGAPANLTALLLHLGVGVLLVPVLLVFTVPHAVAQTRRKPFIALGGAVLLLGSLAVVATGVHLLTVVNPRTAQTSWLVHVVGGFALFGLYVVHRRFGQNPAEPRRLVAAAAVVVALAAGFALWEVAAPGHVSPFETGSAEAAESTRKDFFPSLAASGAGGLVLSADDIKDVASCSRCHRQITDDWKRSAHRHASMTNPFYRATVEDIRQRYPLSDTRWCASCHDPALLFVASSNDPSIPKMIDPKLDFDSEDARVGLTCISCHAVDPQSTLGNGDYVMRGRKRYPWDVAPDGPLAKAHDVLLRLNPTAHVESLRPKNVQTAAFCALCHVAELPPELNRWKWFRTQNEYHSHDDSGVSMGNARSFYHPPAAKRCQDCHMPLVADPDDPAADEKGFVRSHLFSAANTALPHLRGDTEMIQKIEKFLQTACRVDVTAVVLPGERRVLPAWRVKPPVAGGEVVEAQVAVRNLGVGHGFPGGTKDCQEVWLRFEASVGDAPPFYVSGSVDPKTGEVDPSAEFYRGYLLKRDGTRFANRIGLDVYTPVYSKLIGPGTADVVRYRFRVPEGAAGELRLRATLRYRKFIKPFLDFVAKTRGAAEGSTVIRHRLDRDFLVPGEEIEVDIGAHAMPVIDMAKGALDLPIAEQGFRGPPPAIESVATAEDRDRVNDLAIALLLQEDPQGAEALFSAVTRIDPAYPDGWVNVGRARIAGGDFEGAMEPLEKALAIKPGFPKALFFQAEIHRRRAEDAGQSEAERFGEAQRLYEKVLEAFPRDRESFVQLGTVLYEQKKYEEALAVFDRYHAIDAEDWRSWFVILQCHHELADRADVEAAAAKDEAAAAALRARSEAHLRAAEAAHAAHDRFRPDPDITNRRGPYLLADPNLHRLAQPVHVHEQPGLTK